MDQATTFIFGDWGYGLEENPYIADRIMQMLDTRREKKLQGHDDIIYTGNGGGAAGGAANIGGRPLHVYAGDGDDVVNAGKGWLTSFIYGGRGDDTVTVLNGSPFTTPTVIPTNHRIDGGEGDDLIQTSTEEQDSLNFGNVVI